MISLWQRRKCLPDGSYSSPKGWNRRKNNRCPWRVGTISELLLQSPRTRCQHDTVNALTLQHVELMPDMWMVRYLNQ